MMDCDKMKTFRMGLHLRSNVVDFKALWALLQEIQSILLACGGIPDTEVTFGDLCGAVL